MDTINAQGLSIREKGKEVILHPKAVSSAQGVGYADLAIVFVKSTTTGSALEQNAALLGPDTIVLSLQNG